MQTYPGRDPLREVLLGKISVRKFRVMLQHLPPGNAAQRAIHGPWGDRESLLHSIDSRLAWLQASYYNSHVKEGVPPMEPVYLPTPDKEHDADQRAYEQQVLEQQRNEMQAALNRPNPH